MICQCCGLVYEQIHGISECPSCVGSPDELSIHQIAEVMGESLQNIRKIQASAMLILFNSLGELADYRQD